MRLWKLSPYLSGSAQVPNKSSTIRCGERNGKNIPVLLEYYSPRWHTMRVVGI